MFTKDKLGNYEQVDMPNRTGPGENGEGVEITLFDDIYGAQRSVAEYGFNMVISDKISLDRRARDTRQRE